MFKKFAAYTFLSVAALNSMGANAKADDVPKKCQVAIDANGNLAYFSRRLGVRCEVQTLEIPGFGQVRAARIVSEPFPGSPLAQLGLQVGDVITRLDGTPVIKDSELDRHIYDTKVRFVKAGTNVIHEHETWIPENVFYADPHSHQVAYPPANGGLTP